MTRRAKDPATRTRQAHGAPCSHCGTTTYTVTGVCRECRQKGRGYVHPSRLPEDYLQLCAEELLKRQEAREALLVKLGIRKAA